MRPATATALLFLLYPCCSVASAAGAFCGVDHVSLAASEVQLHFAPDHYSFVRIGKVGQPDSLADRMYQDVDGDMHRVFPGRLRPDTAAEGVFLAGDEVAFLGGDAHSSCTVRLAHRGRSFGVTMTLSIGMPGLPPRAQSKFLPASSR